MVFEWRTWGELWTPGGRAGLRIWVLMFVSLVTVGWCSWYFGLATCWYAYSYRLSLDEAHRTSCKLPLWLHQFSAMPCWPRSNTQTLTEDAALSQTSKAIDMTFPYWEDIHVSRKSWTSACQIGFLSYFCKGVRLNQLYLLRKYCEASTPKACDSLWVCKTPP